MPDTIVINSARVSNIVIRAVFCSGLPSTSTAFTFLTSAMHHPKTLIGQALLHQTIVNYTKFFSDKIIITPCLAPCDGFP